MNDNDFQFVAELSKALGHPVRVKILNFLSQQKNCICSPIVDEIGLAQSTVSQHLKILKDAGWIQGNITGNKVCYCVNPAVVHRFKDDMSNFFNSILETDCERK
jgi:ArsR family transcriptional regulator